MSELLAIIRDAWRHAPPHKPGNGSIISLRYARADFDGLLALLGAVKNIEPTELLSRELVAELWSIPYYMAAFIRAGKFQGEEKSKLSALQQEFVVELHRILGTPRQIGNAISSPHS